MNKKLDKFKEEINSKTWKYFWQQKLKEIGSVVLIAVGISIPYFIGLLMEKYQVSNYFSFETGTDFSGIYLEGLVGSLLVVGGLLLILIAFLMVYLFITENWERANKRAIKEIKEREKLK